jgi:hypothetical protein
VSTDTSAERPAAGTIEMKLEVSPIQMQRLAAPGDREAASGPSVGGLTVDAASRRRLDRDQREDHR